MRSQGFLKDNLRSGWKPGQLYLTNQRLVFSQPTRVLFEVTFGKIHGIALEDRRFILRSKEILCLSFKKPQGEELTKAWIMVTETQTWKNKIFERTLLKIDQENINRLAEALDYENQNILLYIWNHSHADIHELALLCGAPNHMAVLDRIRKQINPTSEKILGFPVLTFERSKIDEVRGQKVLFQWWIMGNRIPQEKGREPLLDVFDEGSHINVIAEVTGVKEEDILLEVFDGKLHIGVNNSKSDFNTDIVLPSQVDSEGVTKKYHNTILEVKLPKI